MHISMMGSKKRDLEIVYNLLWKNRPLNADDRSNIVGMYDIPSTTMNWETFKSYLLKNSGSLSADIKVSYIDSDDKEVAIESQSDFQLALYSFRRRARVGEIITLKLDKVRVHKKNEKEMKRNSQINDTEVQTVCAEEPALNLNTDTPPDWFLKYMKKFKKDLMEELNGSLTKLNSKATSSSSNYPRKSKIESSKRSRKIPMRSCESYSADELQRTLQMDSKYETKLVKRERKEMSKQCPRKMLKRIIPMLNQRDTSRTFWPNLSDVESLMDATDVSTHETTIPHMIGGEKFMQQWQVLNSGKLPWTSSTQLRFAWGSESLIPIEKKIQCPPLNPGEKGLVSVYLQVPSTPGNYECYWHFHHFGRRFGRWLGCEVIVDPTKREIDVPQNCETIDIAPLEAINTSAMPIPIKPDVVSAANPLAEKKIEDIKRPVAETNNAISNLNDFNSSDTDNLSILSLPGSNSASFDGNFDYVFVPAEEQNLIDSAAATAGPSNKTIDKIPENTSETLCETEITKELPLKDGDINVSEDKEADYAYIYYNGEKYTFHKRFLNDAYFNEAEKAHAPEEPVSSSSSLEKRSRHSTMSQSSTNRLFVFPQRSPGFEVVYPDDEAHSVNATEKYLNDGYTSDMYLSVGTNNTNEWEDDLTHVPRDSCRCESISSTCNNVSSHFEPQETHTSSYNGSNTFPPEKKYTPECHSYKSSHGRETRHESGRSMSAHDSISSNKDRSSQCYSYASNHEKESVHEAAGSTNDVMNETISHEKERSPQCYSYASSRGKESVHASGSANNDSSASNSNEFKDVPIENTGTTKNESTSTESQAPQGIDSDRYHIHRPNWNPAPENLFTGAAIFASSAMSTARNVMNMVIQTGEGKWVNGHWVAENPNSKRESGLKLLAEMGFLNRDLNATLMARYKDDVHRVISELVQ